MKTLLLASGAGLLAILAAPAAASTPRPVVVEHVEVAHGDLDLATDAGAGAMLDRLSAAASDACGGQPRPGFSDPLGPAKQRTWRLCRVSALDSATLRLDAALVRALWLEDGEAIRLGAEARRTTDDLLEQAGLTDPAAPAHGG